MSTRIKIIPRHSPQPETWYKLVQAYFFLAGVVWEVAAHGAAGGDGRRQRQGR